MKDARGGRRHGDGYGRVREQMVTVVRGGGRRRGRPGQDAERNDNRKLSNYDLLRELGFEFDPVTRIPIPSSGRDGKKERQKFMTDGIVPQPDPAVIRESQAQVHVRPAGLAGDATLRREEHEDWKFIEITPPAKQEPKEGDLV